MSDVVKTGVTANTPQHILFGACTVHKNLKHTTGTGWNYKETIVGATNGGSKMSIVPEIVRPDVDNVHVYVEELTKKCGEKVTVEVNFTEITKDIIVAAALAKTGISDDTQFDMIEPAADIEKGAVWENIALVGLTIDNKPIIAIADNVICTNGFESEPKSKEAAVVKCTFEAHKKIASDNFDTLDWRIYYPKTA